MNDRTSPHLPDPDICFHEDGTPRSRVSDDVYFSTSGAIDETRHVFLAGIGAPAIFATRRSYCIAELGFGTGLNFLTTWRDWTAAAPDGAILHYAAIEGYPMSTRMMYRALSGFPELAEQAAALIERWPPLVKGTHRLILGDGRVHLTLVFGEAGEALAGLSGRFDAWYLDGFAPAKNPAMWTEDVLSQVRARCAPDARVATFTAAGHVRRTLSELGFQVEKRRGFGPKRDCVCGYLADPRQSGTNISANSTNFTCDKTIAIIGAGIAGATLAMALRQRGHKPVLIDAASWPGTAASGNPVALIAPRLTRERVPMGRFIASAYLHAVRFYDRLQETGGNPWLGPRGAFVMARNKDEAARQSRSKAAYGWPDDIMRQVSAGRASVLTNVDIANEGLWFAGAGAISPADVIRQLTECIPYQQARVSRIERTNGGWSIVSDRNPNPENPENSGTFDVVCVAAGVGVMDIMGRDVFPLRANRGQLSYLSSLNPKPRVPITYGGYISPLVPLDNATTGHVLGASYARCDDPSDAGADADGWEPLNQSDTADMLANLADHLAGMTQGEVIGGRTGLRATIRDYIPLGGEWDDGLYVFGSLGSRGFMTAPLLADLIADRISDMPLPLDTDLIRKISPARFKKTPHGVL